MDEFVRPGAKQEVPAKTNVHRPWLCGSIHSTSDGHLQKGTRLEKSEKSEGSSASGSLWGRWRRFYHMACLSWHDVDRVKVLESAEHKSHYCSVLYDLILAMLGLVICAVAVHFLPAAAVATGWAACMSLVCCFGAGCVIFGFYTFDQAYLFLLSYFNQLGVQSIFGPGLWQSRNPALSEIFGGSGIFQYKGCSFKVFSGLFASLASLQIFLASQSS